MKHEKKSFVGDFYRMKKAIYWVTIRDKTMLFTCTVPDIMMSSGRDQWHRGNNSKIRDVKWGTVLIMSFVS